ncbi:phosphopantetheine-binding protein [Streptomyces sp. NPDC057620]|uniref:phosphopantetheine-binding protein n=1 Tax=Streptomyces sp. NPDC057620 TaxID=3346185 RepID=UPI0036B93A37
MTSELARILVDDLHLDQTQLRPDAGLEEAGLDSLALAELAALLAERGVDVSDDALHKATTVEDLAALVETALRAGERR